MFIEKEAMKNSGKEIQSAVDNGKKKTKEERPATKVVVRRLPTTMTEEQFKLQVSPLPEIDYCYFVPADMSLMPNAFSRAYINFVDQSDLFIFTEKFDGYVFVDSKGGEFPAVVEFAPFQRIPKNRPNRKKDPKMGTIESDPIYIQFKEHIEAEALENRASANVSKQHFFETSLEQEKKESNNTPLLDYIKNKRAERQRIRDEKREEKRKKDLERKRAKEEQRRIKKDDDTSVLKVLNSQYSGSRERFRENDAKPSYVKKKFEEVKVPFKEKPTGELRSRDGKPRTGKSYLEERQRQAERREEQRKRLSQTQNSPLVTDAKAPPPSEDKVVVSEESFAERKPIDSESKVKDSDFKKPERPLKREEGRRSSYKYDSKREKEFEDPRRSKRTTDRSYQNSSRRDEERPEDSGRKRYSETRRNQYSPRERYKDKDRNKNYGLKKNTELKADSEKNKSKYQTGNEKNVEESVLVENNIKEPSEILIPESDQKSNNENPKDGNASSELDSKAKPFETNDKTKPTRRKSFEYDKNRQSSSFTPNKSTSREKYTDKNNQNYVNSNKNQEIVKVSSINNPDISKTETKELPIASLEKPVKVDHSEFENEMPTSEEASTKTEFEPNVTSIPKRRNSTGETHSPEKFSSRRNSLGSEDKTMDYAFNNNERKDGKDVISTKDKNKKDEKKQKWNSRDPRTERRIRNKDRPSLEIYRPGMGKFSKQRLEREKGGLGSSTEVESPSSSPSPTPVMKHRILPSTPQ